MWRRRSTGKRLRTSARHLFEDHPKRGLSLDENTNPGWSGHAADYDACIDILRARADIGPA